jgi:hypothetical protein
VRLIAGNLATAIPFSIGLLSCAFFLFLGLIIAKRAFKSRLRS